MIGPFLDKMRTLRGLMANMLDCDLEVSGFEL